MAKSKLLGDSEQKSIADLRKLGVAKLAIERSVNRKISLDALVDELSRDLGYPKDRVIAELIMLSENKQIRLAEKAPYRTLHSYAISPNAIWFWSAIFATMLSVALIFVTSGVELYLRYVFGGLMVLFLPGYALIELLYSKKKELDELTRVALSIGLSLALVPLTGLVLNYTPFGIRLTPVVASLAFLTSVFLVTGLWRKHSYYKLANDVI